IGCGGGDFLKEVSLWANKNGFKVNITGIDLKDDCIEYAKNYCNGIKNIKLIKTDFNNIFLYDKKPDIVHASLFFHHLKDSEIEKFLLKIKEEKVSLIINDLIRSRLAYSSIKILTNAFSKSDLVKNDAPLSVLRGFSKKEWIDLLSRIESLNHSYEIESTIGFRHLVTIRHF
ncbi:MAG: methyltransferase domain-containing protein, partial [Candidatus Sericytochromatia bacterium]